MTDLTQSPAPAASAAAPLSTLIASLRAALAPRPVDADHLIAAAARREAARRAADALLR